MLGVFMKKFEKTNLTNKVFTGVLGGVAKYIGMDSSIVRILFVCSLVFFGFGMLPYFILWLLMPKETSLEQKELEKDMNKPFFKAQETSEKTHVSKNNKI